MQPISLIVYEIFMIACKTGDYSTINDIIKKYAFSNDVLHEGLVIACEWGYKDIVQILSNSGVDPSQKYNVALYTARFNGHFDIMQILLGFPGVHFYGSDTSTLDDRPNTVPEQAKVWEQMLKRKPNGEYLDTDELLFIRACKFNDPETVRRRMVRRFDDYVYREASIAAYNTGNLGVLDIILWH